MATESSLSDRFSGPKGGEIYLRTVKAKVAFVGAEYVGNDGVQRICGLPLGLLVRHYTGPKNRVDLVVWIVPGLLLIGGLAAGAFAVRRWSPGARRFTGATPPTSELSPSDRRLLERALSAMPDEGSR